MKLHRDERSARIRGPQGEIVLRPGQVLRIGRHSDNDIVIKDSVVSRFHATLRWEANLERPFLYDNGSQNGTLVDGEEVRGRAVPLRLGSSFEVAEQVFTIELVNCGETPALLANAPDMVALFSEQGPEIEGTLGVDASAREVLQRLEVERRSGTLRLDLVDGPTAVTVCLGRIMAASDPEGLGMEVLERLVGGRPVGAYRFTRDLEPTERPLNLWFSDFQRSRTKSFRTQQLKRKKLFTEPEGS